MAERTLIVPNVEPSDVEMERNTLGAIFLLGPQALDECATKIRLAPEHFYWESHGAIYSAMLELTAKGRGLDTETVRIELERTYNVLNNQEMRARIEATAGSVPMASNYRDYAQRVVELYTWRQRLRDAYTKLTAIARLDEDAYRDTTALEGVVTAGHDGLLSPEQLLDDWTAWYEGENSNAISTPWREITEGFYGGLRPGDSTVITGWPGMGKSVAGDQILEHAKRVHGANCCVYVNEMSHIDRTSRLLASRAPVSFRKIMRRELNPAEALRALKAAADLPFAMQPCAGWSADAIARHLRYYRWDVAFLDLATRIPASRTSDWDRISGTLADAARQSNTHLLLSVQLNRERNVSAARPMPVLRDLRNTGAWEADHRNVLIVHRREELDRETGVPVLYDDGLIQIAKVSNGVQGTAERVFLNYSSMDFLPLAGSDHALNVNRVPIGDDPFV